MQASDIISQVRLTLVEPVAGFWTDTELLGWINRAEADFFNKTRMFDDKDTSSTIAGVNQYPMPSNCLSIRAVLFNNKTVSTDTDNWQRLVPTNLEKALQENPNFLAVSSDVQGSPASYFIWGNTLFLYPCPNSQTVTDNLIIFFKAKPIVLTTTGQSINVDDSLREALISYVLWKAWEKEQEMEKAGIQQQIYETYVRHGLRWQKKQSGDQRFKLDISSNTPFSGPYDARFNPLA